MKNLKMTFGFSKIPFATHVILIIEDQKQIECIRWYNVNF
jgi:hypothetical protein